MCACAEFVSRAIAKGDPSLPFDKTVTGLR